jgi:hypothetical protein
MDLDKAGCTPEEVADLFHWIKREMPFIKTAIYPQTMFKQLDEYRQRPHTNGNGKTSTWAQAFANQEVPDYIRKMQEAA